MKFFDLTNNAMFLSCWREKTRPATMVSFFILLALILGLMLMNAYYNSDTVYNYSYNPYGSGIPKSKVLAWHEKFLLDISVLQGVIILLLGAVSAYRMADRERTSGTLDFHRSSPAPAAQQMLGLLAGSAVLEWMLFLSLTALSIVLCILCPHYFLDIMYFNLCLALCAALYHAAAILTALFQVNNKRAYGFISVIALLYVVMHLLVMPRSAFTFHLTWQPAYFYLNTALQGFHQTSYYWGSNAEDMLLTLFGVRQPPGVLQFVIQIPLLAFILKGISRKIQHPESLALAKDYLLLVTLYIAFFWTASAFTKIVSPSLYYYYGSGDGELAAFAALILGVGFFAAFMATPTQLRYRQGLIKAKKLGISKLPVLDDHRGVTGWLAGFALITWVFLDIYMYLLKIPLPKSIAYFAVLMSYPLGLAYFCEWFKLSKYHRRPIIVGTILIVLWMLMPIFGSMLDNIFKVDKSIESFFMAFSPVAAVAEVFSRNLPSDSLPEKNQALTITLAMSSILAMAAAIAAYLQRRQLKKFN